MRNQASTIFCIVCYTTATWKIKVGNQTRKHVQSEIWCRNEKFIIDNTFFEITKNYNVWKQQNCIFRKTYSSLMVVIFFKEQKINYSKPVYWFKMGFKLYVLLYSRVEFHGKLCQNWPPCFFFNNWIYSPMFCIQGSRL